MWGLIFLNVPTRNGVVPTRSYYHHLYVKNVVRLAGLLRADGSFAEITFALPECLGYRVF